MLSEGQFAGLHEQMRRSGGFTVDVHTGEQPSEGISVALAPHERIHANGSAGADDLKRFANDRAHALSQPGAHFGSWADTTGTGHDYLDVSMVQPVNRRFPGLTNAEGATAAARHGQLAAYNLGTGETINNPYFGKSWERGEVHDAIRADYLKASAEFRR